MDALIGRKVKLFRQQRQLTQTELAMAIGVSFQQIQKYERGVSRVSASRLLELARVLDVDIRWFFSSASGELSRRSDAEHSQHVERPASAPVDYAAPTIDQSEVQKAALAAIAALNKLLAV